jgi:ribosomal protein S27E
MPRVYKRRFDWDEARRRRAEGESISALAREYGVSIMAVYYAVNDEARARMAETNYRWVRSARCPDCGAQTTRHSATEDRRCVNCAAIARATSVREDELQCITCREWKPDDQFPSDYRRIARRGKHRQCRPCQTKARRDYRHRHREAEAAYSRERYRARKAREAKQ